MKKIYCHKNIMKAKVQKLFKKMDKNLNNYKTKTKNKQNNNNKILKK